MFQCFNSKAKIKALLLKLYRTIVIFCHRIKPFLSICCFLQLPYLELEKLNGIEEVKQYLHKKLLEVPLWHHQRRESVRFCASESMCNTFKRFCCLQKDYCVRVCMWASVCVFVTHGMWTVLVFRTASADTRNLGGQYISSLTKWNLLWAKFKGICRMCQDAFLHQAYSTILPSANDEAPFLSLWGKYLSFSICLYQIIQ